MKKRFIIGMLAVALAVGGVGAGATAGKLMPTVGQLSGVTAVGATSLKVEATSPLTPTGSGFTYQGRLKDGTAPANGQYDFQFTLYDALIGGTLVAGPVAQTNQTVSEGLFTVILDFGASAFNGDARYLEIAVRPTGGGGYTTLSPRQAITPAPYALYALKTKGYKNVVVVSPEGGDFTSIQAALNSITTNSSTNRYLVRVGPGTYSETVTMKQYVDIEGAGELTTKITFTGGASINTGTVVGASNAELRSLTVENTGGDFFAIAIYNGSASPRLLHVTAAASGAASVNFGVYNTSSSPSMTNVTATASGASSNYGVYNLNSSSPSMTNVTATASGGAGAFNYGLYNDSSSPNIRASSISATGGTTNYGVYSSTSGTVTIDNSKITGSTNTTFTGAGVTTRVGASQLSGGAVSNAGTLTCSASYDGNNKRLGALCTPDTKIVIVATTGGDFTTITAALNSITDNSSTNKYLVRVGPGTYSEIVTMKQYVDIEGEGELTTKITFTGSASNNTGTVVGANNAELRFLTVENTGGNTYAIAIYNSSTSPSLLHVTATASGVTFNIAVYNVNSSSPIMNDVTATAFGASGSNNYGVTNVNSSSPTMTNVTATASGGYENTGVSNNNNSSPTMTNVTATAFGASGSNNYGVTNSGSSPTMTNVTATASGGFISYGVFNNSSSPKIEGSTISAGGATINVGIASENSGTVTIDNSKITGSTNTIINGPGATTRVGASQLSGGAVSNAGTLTCSASYDGNNKRLGALCTPDTKIVIVATTGGDFTTITAALNSITDNSSTNKYLVRVGPGTYSERVTMKQYVDIEGAGELTTKITFTGSPGSITGTVVGASNAELRFLTVENTGGNTYAVGIYNSSTSPSLLHVTATASGATSSFAANIAVQNANSSSPIMNDVTATASGGSGSSNYGVYNLNSSSPSMNNVTATASGGTYSYGVLNNVSSSPSMTNVTATASGGSSQNYGVYNVSSSPSMTNVTATASGGSFNYGVFNVNSSSPSMTNVTATASGGSTSIGVNNSDSSARIQASNISASGGTTNYGVYSTTSTSSTVTIDSSKITGSSNTIVNGNGVTTRVGASQLSGGAVVNNGTLSCSASYDESYISPGLNVCP